MRPEDRLREILQSSGADPGGQEPWDQFIQRARRARFRHRVAMSVAAAGVIALGVLGGSVLTNATPDRREPKPAETPDREEEEERERERELDKEDLKEKLRDAEQNLRRTRQIAVGEKGRVGGTDTRSGDLPPPPAEGKKPGKDPQPRDPGPTKLTGKCPPIGGRSGTVTGTNGDDVLRGTSGPDSIIGFGGDDVLIGFGGEDYMCGGPGDDSISGGPGNDLLTGREGNDEFLGGAGHDHVWYQDSAQGVTVDLESGAATGEGTDRVSSIESLVGTQYSDVLFGNAAANGFFTEGGNDTLSGRGGDDVFYPGGGDDDVRGDEGVDTVGYTVVGPDGMHIDLEAGKAIGAGVDSLSGIEAARGTLYNDVFNGNGQANSFLAGSGNDTVTGGAGDDYLLGENGDDRLEGGAGEDTLDGGAGTDVCAGGEQKQSCEASAVETSIALMAAGVAALWRRLRIERRRRRS